MDDYGQVLVSVSQHRAVFAAASQADHCQQRSANLGIGIIARQGQARQAHLIQMLFGIETVPSRTARDGGNKTNLLIQADRIGMTAYGFGDLGGAEAVKWHYPCVIVIFSTSSQAGCGLGEVPILNLPEGGNAAN